MADLPKRLRGDREVAARGELTLDRDKARQKLRMFRLPDPHHYVLQFVRAASILGATKVEFAVAPGGTVCTFDAVLPREPLVDIWSAAFDRRTTREQLALHNVALGLSSAQALNPSRILLESGVVRLTLTDTEETFQEFDRPVIAGTGIAVQEKFKLGHIAEFFTSFVGELPEERALRERCLRSQIDITVNERRMSLDRAKLPGPQRTSSTDDADCWVTLVEEHEAVSFTLLRDDVRVWTKSASSLGFGAIAVMNSRVVETDLSGLSVQKLPAHFHENLYDLYHRAVQALLYKRVVSTYNKPPAEQIRAIIDRLATYIERFGYANIATGTRRLMQFLAEQPAFSPGLVGGDSSPISLADAVRDGAVCYCTRLIRLPDATAHVILARDDGASLNAYAHAGYAIRDVTLEFANEARRHRNRLRWQARPARLLGEPGKDAIVVKHHRLRGTIELCDAGAGQGELYVSGRMLRASPGALPFRLRVDGDLEPDEFFENVERDEGFDDLAVALVGATWRHFANLAGQPIEALAVLTHLASGDYQTELLGMLGYGPTEAEKLLRQHVALRDPDEFTKNVLRDAGALADAKLFFARPDRRCSLREVIENPDAPILCEPRESLGVSPAPTRLVLEVDRDEMKLITLVRPDSGRPYDVLGRELNRDWFFARPKFRPPSDRKALCKRTVVVGDARIDLRLVSGRLPGRAEVYVIHNERLLARHRWTGRPGGWYVLIESDSLRPIDTYLGVVQDTHFKAIQRAFAGEAKSVLSEWRASVIESNELPARAMNLFIELNLDVEPEHMVLPARRYVGKHWVPVLVDLEVLLAAVADGTLFCTGSGGIGGVHPEGRLVLRIRDATDIARLPRQLRDLRFVDVNTAAVEDGKRWLRDAAKPDDLRGALATCRQGADGYITTRTGLYGGGEPGHVVELVWNGGVVEVVDLPTKLGQFHTVAAGTNFEPNPTFTRITHGREDALRLASQGEAHVIEKARQSLDKASIRGDTEPLRRELFRLEKAAARLENPPAWSQELPAKRPLPAASDRAADELEVATALLTAARADRRHLLDDFMLASVVWNAEQEALCHATVTGVTVRADHPLLAQVDMRDQTSVAFLASCICTEINAHYREVSDDDELTLQATLLKAGR